MQKYDKQTTNENLRESLAVDIPNRNNKLNNFIRLLNAIDANQIISIDGAWGCGKTFFIEQMLYLHSNESLDKIVGFDENNLDTFRNTYLPIYYNAWENDYHSDPLESLTRLVVRGYAERKSYLKQDLKKVGQVLGSTLKTVAGVAMEKATGGIITEANLNKLFEGEFDEFVRETDRQDNKKQAIENLFDDILENNKRILLIIDDLDRCKPDFAIRMLEIIKHFYSNGRITILVVTNNQQLASNIEHFYGRGTDGYKYLNRIYDTIITLENENTEDYLIKECSIQVPTDGVAQWIAALCRYFNFSYRDCNRLATMYRILENYLNTGLSCGARYDLFCAAMCSTALTLKIQDCDSYEAFVGGKGVDLLSLIIDFLAIPKNDKYGVLGWLQEVATLYMKKLGMKPSSILRQNIMPAYETLFNNKDIYGYAATFHDAISMLGNNISVN